MAEKEADKVGRAERLAAQLRVNLRRRKEQARGQTVVKPEPPESSDA